MEKRSGERSADGELQVQVEEDGGGSTGLKTASDSNLRKLLTHCLQ